MRNLHQILSEIAEPKSPAEKNFKDKHVVDVQTKDDQETVVAATKKTKKDKTRIADYQDGEDEAVYEAEEVHTDESAFIAKAAYSKKEGKKKFKLGDEEFPVTIKKSTVDKVTKENIDESKMSNSEVLSAAKALAKNAKDDKTRSFGKGLVDFYDKNGSFAPAQVGGLQNIMKNAGFQMAKEDLDERSLTPDEEKEKEDIVMGMKKNKEELKKRYGADWKSVMYATATKRAQESVNEAVEVSQDRYMRSHGKKASGRGLWMFSSKRSGDVDYTDTKQVYQPVNTINKSFVDAAKDAAEWAKKHGHSVVYVMESLNELKEQVMAREYDYAQIVPVSGEYYIGIQYVEGEGPSVDLLKQTKKPAGKMDKAYKDMGAVSVGRNDKTADFKRKAEQMLKKMGLNEYYDMGMGAPMAPVSQRVPEDSDIVNDLEREVAEAKLRSISFKIDYVNQLIDEEDFELPMGACGYIDMIKSEVDALYGMVESMAPMDESNTASMFDEKIQKLEEARQAKQLYFKTYSDAVQAAMDTAKKRGFEVDEDEYFRKVSAGDRKPSEGKTVSKSLQLMKDGKPLRKTLEFQVYNRGGNVPFELNHYIGESVELEEAKTDMYHKLMLKALDKTSLPKNHQYTSAVASNGDFVVYDGGRRVVGRLLKGQYQMKETRDITEKDDKFSMKRLKDMLKKIEKED
jgi:hypothetical protein